MYDIVIIKTTIGLYYGFFKLLTDFDLKQTTEGNPGAETITKTQLQSANAFLQNEMLHSNEYTHASAFVRPDTTHLNYSPVRTSFLKSNIALECWGSNGTSNVLAKFIITDPSQRYFTTNDVETPEVSTEGKATLANIEFKVVDFYGNVVNLQNQNTNFTLYVSED